MREITKWSILLLVLLLSALALNSFPAYGQPSVPLQVTRVVWGASLDTPGKVYPGDTGVSLIIEVQNLSPADTIKGISAILQLPNGSFTDIYGNDNATATGEPTVGDIFEPSDEVLPKGFFTLAFTLDIASNTSPGSYSREMNVAYSVKSGNGLGGGYLEGVPQTLLVSLVVSKTDISVSCTVSPPTLLKDETVVISGSIAPVIENVPITLTYKNPDGLTRESTVRTHVDGSYRDLFQPDVEGLWGVNATWSGDENYAGNWTSSSFEVRFPVSLSIIPSTNWLVGGVDNHLTIRILNTGNVPVSAIEVAFSVTLPLVVSGSSQWTFNHLQPGGAELIPIGLFAPATSIGSTYTGSMTLDYRDDYGEEHSDEHTIGLIVGGTVELVVYDESVSPSPVRPGFQVSITATLLNKGSISAEYVNASVVPHTMLELTEESAAYIGEVEENAPTPFTILATVDRDTPNGTYPISLRITYRDDRRLDHALNITLSLLVEETPESNNGSGSDGGVFEPLSEVGVILIVLVCATIAVVVLHRRQRTRSKAS